MDKEELIRDTMALAHRLGHKQMRRTMESWKKLDVPLAQLKSLFLIHSQANMNVRQLAAELCVTPGNVTSIVDRLITQELVTRSGDPADRRQVFLKLTDKGLKTIREIGETGMGKMRSVLEKMDVDDIAALNRGINALLNVLEKDQEETTNKTI